MELKIKLNRTPLTTESQLGKCIDSFNRSLLTSEKKSRRMSSRMAHLADFVVVVVVVGIALELELGPGLVLVPAGTGSIAGTVGMHWHWHRR